MRFIVAIIICLASFSPAFAVDLIRVDGNDQVTIRADQITNNDVEKTILAVGEVEISKGDHHLYADEVLLNTETMIADAQGNVRFTTITEMMRGSRMLADLNTGQGKVYEARVFNRPTNFYLNGKEIERLGQDVYRIKDGSITSCNDELPPWRFSSSEINLEVEGYATSQNTTFDIMGVPAMWAPWFIFPVKTKRQSGLLFPEFGYSDRDGILYSQSYFQVIDESQDLTLTANVMGRRGVDWGVEYRYSLTEDSKGMFMLDVLPEDAMGDDLFADGSNADAYNTRYWLRGKADQRLGPNTTLRLDMDIVSDRDYLQEFNYKETGYQPSFRRFRDWFRRDIDTENSLTRTNLLNLNHLRETESLNLGLRYNDRLDNLDDVTLHDLPQLSWDMTRRTLYNSPLYFQMDSVYNYMYRREGSKGHIVDLEPALAMPVNFSDYIMVEPRFTWRPQLFSLDALEDDKWDNSGFTNNINFTVDTSSYLYSVYALGSGNDGDSMLKHVMRPVVSYSYQSGLSGENLPWLIDRREYKFHRISYGLNNTFTVKTVTQQQTEDEDTTNLAQAAIGPRAGSVENLLGPRSLSSENKALEPATPTADSQTQYNEFLRFNLAHAFYIDPYVENYSLEERQWGNIEGRLEISPFNDYRVSLTVDTAWDVYRGDFDEVSVLLTTRNQRGDYLSLDYTNRAYDILNPIYIGQENDGRTQQVRGWAHLNVGHGFSLTYMGRYDIERNVRFENTFSVNYASQCWGISFIFHEDEREQGYYVAFDLAGLGLFGR